MSPQVEDIIERIHAAEADLVHEIEAQRRQWHYRVRRGHVWFDQEVRRAHRQQINCTFCSYANGLIAYVREVAARTEQYWGPIKHASAIHAPHALYHLFFDYGDAEGYRRHLGALRKTLGRQPARGRRS